MRKLSKITMRYLIINDNYGNKKTNIIIFRLNKIRKKLWNIKLNKMKHKDILDKLS